MTGSSVLFGTLLSTNTVEPNTICVVDDIGGGSNKPNFLCFVGGHVQGEDVGTITVLEVTVLEVIGGGSRELALGSIQRWEVFTIVGSDISPQWLSLVDKNSPVVPDTSNRCWDVHFVSIVGGDDVIRDFATRSSGHVRLGAVVKGGGDVEFNLGLG